MKISNLRQESKIIVENQIFRQKKAKILLKSKKSILFSKKKSFAGPAVKGSIYI